MNTVSYSDAAGRIFPVLVHGHDDPVPYGRGVLLDDRSPACGCRAASERQAPAISTPAFTLPRVPQQV